MRWLAIIATVVLCGCVTAPEPERIYTADRRATGLINTLATTVVHAYRTDTAFGSFDNNYPMTWNVAKLLDAAILEHAAVPIVSQATPAWLADNIDSWLTRADNGRYRLAAASASQLGSYCRQRELGRLIVLLSDNRERLIQGVSYQLKNSGALEVEAFGVNPFVAYNNILALGIDCDSARLFATASSNALQPIENFQPPPGSLPQVELDKTRPYFQQIANVISIDLLSQMNSAKPRVAR